MERAHHPLPLAMRGRGSPLLRSRAGPRRHLAPGTVPETDRTHAGRHHRETGPARSRSHHDLRAHTQGPRAGASHAAAPGMGETPRNAGSRLMNDSNDGLTCDIETGICGVAEESTG